MNRLNGMTDVQNCRLNRAKNKTNKTKLLECIQTMAYAVWICGSTQSDQRPNKICDSLLTIRRQKYISQNATTTLIKSTSKIKVLTSEI